MSDAIPGAAVRDAIAAERQAAHDWLARLDAAESLINGRVDPQQLRPAKPETPAPARKAPKRRSAKADASPAAALKRRSDIHRYIHAQGGEVKSADVRNALDVSENAFRGAASKLVKAGKLRRIGERQHTRYESIQAPEDGPTTIAAASPQAVPEAGPEGTPQGRILAALDERPQGLTLGYLADFAKLSGNSCSEALVPLIEEGEVEQRRVGDTTIYVRPAAAEA